MYNILAVISISLVVWKSDDATVFVLLVVWEIIPARMYACMHAHSHTHTRHIQTVVVLIYFYRIPATKIGQLSSSCWPFRHAHIQARACACVGPSGKYAYKYACTLGHHANTHIRAYRSREPSSPPSPLEPLAAPPQAHMRAPMHAHARTHACTHACTHAFMYVRLWLCSGGHVGESGR